MGADDRSPSSGRLAHGRRVAVAIGVVVLLGLGSAWLVASSLTSTSLRPIGPPPPGLPTEDVVLASASGTEVHGWFVPTEGARAAILLVHPLRADRTAMASRAVMLHRAGYAVLLIDLRGHGESHAEEVTFGWEERHDVEAAIHYLRHERGFDRVGALGDSLGGVSILMADRRARLDAVVLEQVFPDFEDAVADRVAMRLGGFLGDRVAPLLTMQSSWRLGFRAEDLRPIDRIADLGAPVFVLGGAVDEHTPPHATRVLFDAAVEPKRLWIVPGAGHANLFGHGRATYRERVLAFFREFLPPG